MTLKPPKKINELSWNLRAQEDLPPPCLPPSPPKGSFPNHLRELPRKQCPLGNTKARNLLHCDA